MSRPATDRLKCNPPLGTPPVLQFVAPSQLHLDPTYQRTIDTAGSQALIRKIAQFWDWGLCQPLNVARRADGKMYVIDGQHRLAAARLRRDIQHLPAVVLTYETIADEAASFVHLNQQRRPLTRLDLFKAAVASGDSEATLIVEALKEAGLSVAPHSNFTAWKPGAVANIGGIEHAWRHRGAVVTRLALKAMGSAWRGQVLQYAGTLLPGIVAICAHEATLAKTAFTPASWSALIAMLSKRSQIEWRAAVLAARAADPDLDFRRAAERAFLDAWDQDELEGLVGAVEARATRNDRSAPPQVQPVANGDVPGSPSALAAALTDAVSGRAKAAPVAPAAPAPAAKPGGVRTGKPSIPTGLFGKHNPVSGARKFTPGADRKDFCFQCDRRVGATEMTNCKDRFCTFKRGE